MGPNQLTKAVLLSTFAREQKIAVALRKVRRISDGGGLMLVIGVNGSASWVWRFKVQKKVSDFTLGPWPVMSLAEARLLADHARELLKVGQHPAALRSVPRAIPELKNAQTDSIQALFEDWMALAKLKLSTSYQTNIRAAMSKHILPILGHVSVQAVACADIQKCLDALSSQGAWETRKRLAMWLRRMFDFGLASGRYPGIIVVRTLSSEVQKSNRARQELNTVVIRG